MSNPPFLEEGCFCRLLAKQPSYTLDFFINGLPISPIKVHGGGPLRGGAEKNKEGSGYCGLKGPFVRAVEMILCGFKTKLLQGVNIPQEALEKLIALNEGGAAAVEGG
jgi:hypothetical protein